MGKTAGIGRDLADGFHLCSFVVRSVRYNQTDITGAEDDHAVTHLIAHTVGELLSSTSAVNTDRTAAADAERAAAAFATALDQNERLA